MKEYHVEWSIDISASSPLEAACFALEIQRDPNSIATVFYVFEEGKDEGDFAILDVKQGRSEWRFLR